MLGDDLLPRVDELRKLDIREMDTGAELPAKIASMNAYLGGFPIARALAEGADVVITGRCVNSAVTLGALIHDFGWSMDDHDRLAAGTLCGHIIECGAQCNGGNFTDWRLVPDYDDMGFPVAEVESDGCVRARQARRHRRPDHAGHGGRADALRDRRSARLHRARRGLRLHRGALRAGRQGPRARVGRQGPAADRHLQGLDDLARRLQAQHDLHAGRARGGGQGPGTAPRRSSRRRAACSPRRAWADYRDVSIEIIGGEATYGPHARTDDSREVVVKIAAKHDQKEALALLGREIAPMSTGGVVGMTGSFGAGRASPHAGDPHVLLPGAQDAWCR